jgi:hypothetical protein
MAQEILQFEEKEYKLAIATLNKMGEKLKLLYSALDDLTGGQVDLITPSELDGIICKGTKFTNGKAVANLLGLATQYDFYIENYNQVDERLFEAPNWNIKEHVIEEVKQKYTYLMTETASGHYKEMQKIADILNKKPDGFGATIQKNGIGYFINKQLLNNLTIIYERNN